MQNTSFKARTPIQWGYGHFSLNGVVLHNIRGNMIVVPVLGMEPGMHSYDDPDAIEELDQDHVLLRHCDEIFENLRSKLESGACCAMASKAATVVLYGRTDENPEDPNDQTTNSAQW